MTIDRETVEVLQDEPELLAIADALQSAGDRLGPMPSFRRQRPRRLRVAAVALAVAALVAVALASPWDSGSGPSFVDKARAAVGNRPILHVVLRYALGERLDLRTGRSGPVLSHAELWYDNARHVFRVVSSRDGRIVFRKSGRGNLGYEPFLLTSLYRQALAKGKLHKFGETIIRGRKAIVVTSKLPHEGEMRASLDAHTFRLLRMEYFLNGRLGYQLDVLRFETVSREQARLPKHPPATSSSIHGSSTLSDSGSGSAVVGEPALDSARTAFGRPAVWPGRAIGGHRLIVSQLERQTATENARTVHGQMLTLDYGPRDHVFEQAYLEIQEAPARSSLWTLENVYPPPAGHLDLTSGQTSTNTHERTQWTGVMRRNGLTVQLTSWSRTTLIAAARALRPLP